MKGHDMAIRKSNPTSTVPADARPKAEPEVKLRVTGGSYANIVKYLPHPYCPSWEMMAKGLVHLLETNHFDAALAVVHTLADLLDDFALQQRHGDPASLTSDNRLI